MIKNLILCLILGFCTVISLFSAYADEESFPLTHIDFSNFDWGVNFTPNPKIDAEIIRAQQIDQILSDFKGRLSDDFKIPGPLRERTEFWFKIYTQYGEQDHVIHHSRYPWIVLSVVNTSDFINSGKGPLWLRRDRGNKHAAKELANFRLTLKRMSQKTEKNFSLKEKEIAKLFQSIPGKRSRVYREASLALRSQLGQKDFFMNGLINSSRYLPYMEEIFAQANLPTELTRMPFVESSFNEKAFSKVGASGIWQFMERTGRSYMTVSESVDERNSPIKATRAAARLLKSYYRAFDSWPLTITSYNHGIGNIQKAIRAAKSKDLAEIIERYHQGDFKFASSNFYTCFLAALYAEKYHDLIFQDVPRLPLMEREVVRLSKNTSLNSIQKMTGLSLSEILRYNLDLRANSRASLKLPRGFQLHLPPGFSNVFSKQAEESTPIRKSAKRTRA